LTKNLQKENKRWLFSSWIPLGVWMFSLGVYQILNPFLDCIWFPPSSESSTYQTQHHGGKLARIIRWVAIAAFITFPT